MGTSWPFVELGEVMHLALDAHPVEVEQEYPNLGIYNFGRGAFRKAPIQGCSTSASTLYRVKAGQFIYSRLFAFEGAYTVVPDTLGGAFVSNEFPTFDVDPAYLDVGYLRWLFRRPVTWSELASEATGMGDRRQRIHPEQVLAHPVPLPPLSKQRQIVAQLDAAAERVEAHRRDAAAIGAELDAALASAFRRITAGVPRAYMGDVAPLVRREVAIDPDASYPELGIRSHGKGTFHKAALPGIEVGSKRLFRVAQGDLVFNIVFAWEGAVAIAAPADHGRFGSHRFLTCVADPGRATASFLRYALLTPEGLQRLGEASPGGAGRNRTLGLQALTRIEVPLPSLDAQCWFDAIGERAGTARSRMKAAEADLASLLPSLLHRAFGGDVEPVPAIPETIAAE